MIQVDDYWCNEAKFLLPNTDKRVLIASLDKRYDYDDCKTFDLIASCTTGTDHIDNRDVPLIKLEGEFLRDIWATAEMTWSLILSLIRKVPFAFDSVRRGEWDREAFQGIELRGKTLGIIGYGRVGQQMATIGKAFGMKVLFCDKAKEGDFKIGKPINTFDGFFMGHGHQKRFVPVIKRSDIITVHVPLTEETRGMFGIEQFLTMKPTAYFINTSRGAVVDEVALINALDEKIIAGAALDVINNEHAGEWVLCNDPSKVYIYTLRDYAKVHDNLIITPHIGGNTVESREKTQIYVANKIKEYINTGGERK